MFTSGFYSSYPSFVLGFHGCEKEIAEKILTGSINHIFPSELKKPTLSNKPPCFDQIIWL